MADSGQWPQLLAWMRQRESLLVAYSGGVDSALVLAAAAEALGPNAVALTADSPALPRREVEEAAALAQTMGVRHLIVPSNELDDLNYAANPANRCFYCKSELYRITERVQRELGLAATANGVNTDDLGDYRPGLESAKAAGVLSPLVELGINKAGVRWLARQRGLPIWDKPATPCLASRLATGTAVTPERLGRIERAEENLRSLGLRILRLRVHEEIARLELGVEEMARFHADAGLRSLALEAIQREGFRFVTLDLEGFRSGSLNPR